MLKLRNAAVGLGLLAAVVMGTGAAMAASAVQGYTTASVNLRAGPSTSYPVVAAMGAGDRVTIYGCLSGWTWCDIDWKGARGWAAGRYLEVLYEQQRRPVPSYGQYLGLPALTFGIGSYWQQHYGNRSFFSDMQRYQGSDAEHKPPAAKNQPPQGQLPQVQQPKVQLPQVQQPKVEQPKIQQLQAQPPQGQLHQAQQPNAKKPGILLPNVGQSHGQKCAPGQKLVNGVCK